MRPKSTPFPLLWDPPHGYKEKELEWTLNQFETSDTEALSLVALNVTETWETIPELAARRRGTLILGIFLPILQLEHSFAAALRRSRLPAFYLPPQQVDVVPALMSEVPVGTIVSLWRDRSQMQAIIKTKQLKNVFFEMVLAPHERPGCHKEPNTGFEMHLVPGLVGYLQCEELAGTDMFHPSERFDWEFSGGHALVTDKSPRQRFSKASVPGTVRAESVPCTCGRRTRVTLL